MRALLIVFALGANGHTALERQRCLDSLSSVFESLDYRRDPHCASAVCIRVCSVLQIALSVANVCKTVIIEGCYGVCEF